jgi:orotidine-5'-phosphate decarboxylase
MSTYKRWIDSLSKRKKTRTVLALDVHFKNAGLVLSRAYSLLKELGPYICAVKINFPVLLPVGLYSVGRLITLSHELDLPVVMDCKVSDVGHMNELIVEHYFNVGFDAVTASPIIGWDGGLKPIVELARDLRKGVILLVYMSHKGADEGFALPVIDPRDGKTKPQYQLFAERALKWGMDGVVVGATYPDKVKRIHAILKGEIPIYSPGVGIQGGDVEAALKAGSKYLIVGRMLTSVKSPTVEAKKLMDLYRKYAKA